MKKISDAKMFVLDMDGTIYLDSTPIDGAIDFCKKLYDRNMLLYFTNNASKDPNDYVNKLKSIGFPCERKNIMTSGDVTIEYLRTHHPKSSVYLVGTPELEKSFVDAGIELSDNAEIVVVSFDKTLTYGKLERACTLICNGALFYSTHEDINCPTADGFIPDSGAICCAIELSTGVSPRYFGKPHEQTVEMIEKVTNLSREEICIVGDRLYTDIALGVKNGMMSALVLSGETTAEMLEKADQNQRPDYVFDSICQIPLD